MEKARLVAVHQVQQHGTTAYAFLVPACCTCRQCREETRSRAVAQRGARAEVRAGHIHSHDLDCTAHGSALKAAARYHCVCVLRACALHVWAGQRGDELAAHQRGAGTGPQAHLAAQLERN